MYIMVWCSTYFNVRMTTTTSVGCVLTGVRKNGHSVRDVMFFYVWTPHCELLFVTIVLSPPANAFMIASSYMRRCMFGFIFRTVVPLCSSAVLCRVRSWSPHCIMYNSYHSNDCDSDTYIVVIHVFATLDLVEYCPIICCAVSCHYVK